MNRRLFLKSSVYGGSLLLMGNTLGACAGRSEFYSVDDFMEAPKLDSHFHYDLSDGRFLEFSRSIGMNLLSINVDAGMPLKDQFDITTGFAQKYPSSFYFLGSFSMDHFGSDSFVDETIAQIDRAMKAGAKGIKIWKNIGMVVKDHAGNYVMVDHSALSPVFRYLEENSIPVVGHLGEPRNCWLSFDQMTMDNDFRYYSHHPEYHMFAHPECPSYEDQINARDRLLQQHPGLKFVGAHIGSMEWNLKEVAKHFDQYPNFYVDLSARIGHVQLQAYQDRDFVERFFFRYQDRIMYGSDTTLDGTPDVKTKCESLLAMWKTQWEYYATDEMLAPAKFRMENAPEKIKGLHLPRKIVDKLFWENASGLYHL